MYGNKFIQKLENTPIVAAVKDDNGLDRALSSDIGIIFILYGNVCTISDITKRIKQADKMSFVHVDLIEGLNSKPISLDFLKKNTQADGIITTKPSLISHASQLGFYTILRFFLLDSMAITNIEKQSSTPSAKPDVIEILPGAVQKKLIQQIVSINKVPTMAGGLIADKDDVMNALNGGAVAISTTNQNVWFM